MTTRRSSGVVRIGWMVGCLWLAATRVVVAQDPAVPDPLAEEAASLFAYEEGTWTSRWEILGPEGEVVSEFEGTEVFSYAMDGKALLLETRSEGQSSWSQSVRFYNPQERKIIFLSWSTEGDYWTMKQDVETEVLQSDPKTMPDGTELILRFRILRKTDDEQDVVMEYSKDAGESWVLRTRQYLRRAG